MKRRVELRPQAAEELELAIDWYESEREGLGARFLDAVTQALETIAENPRLGASSSETPETRRWVVERFPYLVLYRLTEQSVIVLAIAHGKRRPGYWSDD